MQDRQRCLGCDSELWALLRRRETHRAGPTVLEQNPKVEDVKDQLLQIPVSCGEQVCFYPESSREAPNVLSKGSLRRLLG